MYGFVSLGQGILLSCIGVAIVIVSTGVSASFWQKWATDEYHTAGEGARKPKV